MDASEAARDAAAVRIFPPGVPLATVLLGVLLQWLVPVDLRILDAPARYWVGGAIIAGSILLLGLPAILRFRRVGQSANPWKPTPSIERRGPFRFTRNPMYLQMVIACVGFAVLLANAWILLLTPVCVWVLQHHVIQHEEAYLERKFGDEYLSYKGQVRRWI